MSGNDPHRKRVRHYDEPGHFHELTFSCYRRMPLLTNNTWRGMLSHSIDRAVTGQGYRLAAFVYMPEHVHMIVYPMCDSPALADSGRATFYAACAGACSASYWSGDR